MLAIGMYWTLPASGVWPPAMTTSPEGSTVAVWLTRAVAILPVLENALVAGSYNSAVANALVRLHPDIHTILPPAMRTRPSLSSDAVWSTRAVDMFPALFNDPVVGSYNSALDWFALPLVISKEKPPAISTLPSFSNVAVWSRRVSAMLPLE